MPQWTKEAARDYWNARKNFVIMQYPNAERRWEKSLQEMRQRKLQRKEARKMFFEENNLSDSNNCTNAAKQMSNNLAFWIINSSWLYCNNCKMLNKEKLFPKFRQRQPTTCTKRCQCSTNRYPVPRKLAVPEVLTNLTTEDNFVLRPIDLHIGDYKRMEHGYRRKNGITRVNWSKLSVEEKIANLDNDDAKQRCTLAFRHLMTDESSFYKKFVTMRERCLQEDKYSFRDTEGIECCLWPSLYPLTDWCESSMSDGDTRLSGKIAFITKVLSEISDYSLHFELLQFHFDRWIFKTVTGAINV